MFGSSSSSVLGLRYGIGKVDYNSKSCITLCFILNL